MVAGRDQISDSGRPGKQLGHPADPSRDHVGNFGAARGAHRTQKDEMCVFTAPAHNKKRPSGKVVIMRSNVLT